MSSTWSKQVFVNQIKVPSLQRRPVNGSGEILRCNPDRPRPRNTLQPGKKLRQEGSNLALLVGVEGENADVERCQVFTRPLVRDIAPREPVYTQGHGFQNRTEFGEVREAGKGYFWVGESPSFRECECLELGPGF